MKDKSFWFALGCLLIVNMKVAGGDLDPFYIEGTFRQEVVRGGSVVSQSEFHYNVWVDSPRWTIRMFDTDRDNERSYGAYGSDGENVYWYLWDQTSMSANPERREVVGRVNEGDLPLAAHQRPFLVWFAFCSAAYFKSIDDYHLVPAPWANPRFSLYSAATEAKMSFLSSGLPKLGEFTLSREAREEGIRRGWVESHALQRAEMELAEFPDGFLLGVYRVIESGEFEIPRKVAAEVFWPDDSGSTEGWLECVYTLTVSKVQVGDLDGLGGPIKIPEGFAVSMYDTRLKDSGLGIDFTFYRLFDGIWPSELPEEGIAAFEGNRVRRSTVWETEKEASSGQTVGIIAVIVALGLLPVVFLLLKK